MICMIIFVIPLPIFQSEQYKVKSTPSLLIFLKQEGSAKKSRLISQILVALSCS